MKERENWEKKAYKERKIDYFIGFVELLALIFLPPLFLIGVIYCIYLKVE
jgi:hypothetical protein